MRSDSKAYKLLQKSKDAALLGVEIYNKPRTKFRSSGYIVMMHIAWTSLFHAIFESEGTMYYYKQDNGYFYQKVNGDYKTWEINRCLEEYSGELNNPVRKNLKFFITIRNKIQHRFAPELDHQIFGECQSLLMNYERLLMNEFGEKNAIHENLVFSLQFANILHQKQQDVFHKRQTQDYNELKTFVDNYRSRLDENTLNSLDYSFRVYLLPKVGNHESSSDFTIEFIPYDVSKPEEMKKYKKFLVAIKEKRGPVDGLTPSEVAEKVYKDLKNNMSSNWKFTASSHHARCWKYYKVRPPANSNNPDKTDVQYCVYNKPYDNYIYTEQWVNFLITKLADKNEYKKVMKTQL